MATGATLFAPSATLADNNGDIFIADTNNQVVRRVSATTGIITTVAGTGSLGFTGDAGPATSAELNFPLALAIDQSSNLYISDDGNNVIREVTFATGIVNTVAGMQGGECHDSGDGGPAAAALLCDPEGLAVDAANNLYIIDSGDSVVRKVSASTGFIDIIAGSPGVFDYSGDGGPALAALLNYPSYPAIDGAGDLFVTDDCNSVIRELSGVAPLVFGTTGVGATSPQQDVTVTNNGSAPMIFSALAASANFNLEGSDTTCTSSITLNPGQSCILGVQFAPGASGLLTGMVTITSNAGTQQINLSGMGVASTTTGLTALPNPANIGDTVTFSASVTPTPDAGSVNFLDGSTSLGIVNVNNMGNAVLMTSALTIGSHSITAMYSGDSSFGSSTSSLAITEVIDALAPALTSILPTSASVGGAGFTLTATGTNFISSSVVNWNGTALTTTFVSATSLTATVPASDIAAAGTASVTVFTPTPGGGTTAPQTFTINNPAPTITSLFPTFRIAGSAGFTLDIAGTNFVSGSVVDWNGTALSTSFVSATSLTASVPASDIVSTGTVPITVVNSAPGGGTSSPVTFSIDNPAPGFTSEAPISATAGGSEASL